MEDCPLFHVIGPVKRYLFKLVFTLFAFQVGNSIINQAERIEYSPSSSNLAATDLTEHVDFNDNTIKSSLTQS